MPEGLRYDQLVNYAGGLDAHKVASQEVAASTDELLLGRGFRVLPWTRGESCFLIETPREYLAFVVEGLGTKNLVADALAAVAHHMEGLTGRSFYDHVAQCTVAMIVNDMITLGAQPLVLGQYLAVESAEWFNNAERSRDLILGTKQACELAQCVWGPGETPALRDIIVPGAADLAGAAMGVIPRKEELISPANIQAGDRIYFFGSSGIHANGLTLAREIAKRLPDGYLTEIAAGVTYGEALLRPTHIYVQLVRALLAAGVSISYAVNITGHGWRKLMRAPQHLTYVIDEPGEPGNIFRFIQQHGGVDDKEAYGNLNMGAGFAVFIPESAVARFESVMMRVHVPYTVLRAGYIENGPKRVVIPSKNITFEGESLAVR